MTTSSTSPSTTSAPPPGPPPARPPLPWWAAVLAVLGVVVVLTVVSGVVGAVVVEAATRTREEPVAQTGVRTLRIEGVTGGVRLDGDAAAGSVQGTSRVTTSWQQATVETLRDGDELTLRATCPDQGWPRRCEVAYDLAVDPDVDVVVDIVTGGLQAQGLAGKVDVSVSAGGVLLERSTSSDVRVDVTTGGVALEFLQPPRQVEVGATTGGVDISVPSDGTAYAVRTSVTVGDAGVSVPVDDDARHSITASTTVGGINVHSDAEPGWDGPGGPGA